MKSVIVNSNSFFNPTFDVKKSSAKIVKALILSFLSNFQNEEDVTITQKTIDNLLSVYKYENYYNLLRNIVNDQKMLNEAHNKIFKIISDYNESSDYEYVFNNNNIDVCKNDVDEFILLHLESLKNTKNIYLSKITYDVLDFMLYYNRHVI